MTDDNKVFVISAVLLAIVLCTLIIGLVWYNGLYLREGYEEQLVPGSARPIWVKKNKEPEKINP